MIKKMIALGIVVLMVFSLMGCSIRKTIEIDGWTLFQYRISQGEYEGKRISIVSANSESLVKDGVLTIPAKIGRYDVFAFGRPSQGVYGPDQGEDFGINADFAQRIERIVIAEEIFVGSAFYANFGKIFGKERTIYVEFLSSTFERVRYIGGWDEPSLTIISIIPDGSTQNFINRRSPANPPNPATYIEKSKYLEGKDNV